MTQDIGSAAAAASLPGIGDLLTRGWKIYRSRPGRFIALMLIGLLATVLATTAVFAVLVFTYEKIKYTTSYSLLQIFSNAALTLMACVFLAASTFSFFALLAAAIDEGATVGTALKAGLRKILPGLWIMLASSVLIMGGSLIFIVPGIVLAVWFAFSPVIVASGEARGLNALLRSKAAVKGRWFPVFGRLFLLNLLASVLSATIIGILLLPLPLICLSLLYRDLKERAPELPETSPAAAKFKVAGFAAAGYVAAIALVVIFPQMRQQTALVSQPYAPVQPSAPVQPPTVFMVVTAPFVEVFDSDGTDAKIIGTISRAEQVRLLEKGEKMFKIHYSTPSGEDDLVGWVDGAGLAYPETEQAPESASIVGTWCGQNEQPGSGCYRFSEDGTVGIECPMCFHGTWTQQGDTVSISLEGPDQGPAGERLEPVYYSGTMTLQSNNNSMVADFPKGDGSGHNEGGTWMVYRQ